MNDHPEELLAGYVDGSLGADERARVEQHLSECGSCREEVELATAGRAALASMPELDAPRGIPLGVRRKARGAPPRFWRLAGTAAAAAILAGGTILVFSSIELGGQDGPGSGQAGTAPERPAAGDAKSKGGGGGGGLGEASTEEEAAPSLALTGPPPVLPIYQESKRDYEPKDLAPLARRLRDDANAALDAGLAPTATAFYADFDPSPFTPEVRGAIDCVLEEVPPEQLVVPYRIEAASFQGEPAYIAAFLQGPTRDDPYDRLVIWVVRRESCGLISLASQLL